MTPLRKVFLIGSQTSKGKHLYGVEHDLRNMRRFLLSVNGGAWLPDEITTFYNEPYADVLNAVRSGAADYVFCYFSGHGFTSGQGNRMMCFKDANLEDVLLLNNAPRQLVIVDACRTLQERGAAIGNIPWAEEQWNNFDGSSVRAVFDQFILDSPHGALIVHATGHDTYAYEDGVQPGGQFTNTLLQTINYYQLNNYRGPLSVPLLVASASETLQQKLHIQSPGIVYRRGHFNVPLALTSPGFAVRQRIAAKLQQFPLKNDSSAGILLGAGILLLLLVMAD